MKETTKAHLAVLAANFIFGAAYSVVKTITPEFIAPFALNVVRVLSSLLLFWILFLMKPSKAGIERKDIPRFLLCAVTGVAINQLFFIKGLSLTTAIHSSLLSLGTPIFITIIAAWLLKERLTINKIIGLALGIGGATMLILIKDQKSDRFVYVVQEYNKVTIMDAEFDVLFDYNLVSENLKFQYYSFGADKNIFVLIDPIQEFTYLFNLEGEMLNTLPINSKDEVEIKYSSSKNEYSIFVASGNTFVEYRLPL